MKLIKFALVLLILIAALTTGAALMAQRTAQLAGRKTALPEAKTYSSLLNPQVLAEKPAATSDGGPGPAKDTTYEMPGVFRITLPPGWRQDKVVDDRHTIAVFSNEKLTLEVIRDMDNSDSDHYANMTTERRMRPDADAYAGKYAPQEVRDNPAAFVARLADRFDEYRTIGGLPSQWMSYRWQYTRPEQSAQSASKGQATSAGAVPNASVWTIFTLSPGEYWGLEIRGKEDEHFRINDLSLLDIIHSFQLLDPILSRVKAHIPKEAFDRMPSAHRYDDWRTFMGTASGMGIEIPCALNYFHRQVRYAPSQDPLTSLPAEGAEYWNMPNSQVALHHETNNMSPADYAKYAEDKLIAEIMESMVRAINKGSRNDKDKVNLETIKRERNEFQVTVDGFPATKIFNNLSVKKKHAIYNTRLLIVSKGADHFYLYSFYNREHCSNDVVGEDDWGECIADEVLGKPVHIYALRPKIQLESTGLDKVNQTIEDFTNLATVLAGRPEAAGPSPTPENLERARQEAQLLNNSESHYALGALLKTSGKQEEAFAEFKAAARLNPRHEKANLELGATYALRGNLREAIAAYERILCYATDAANDAMIHGHLAGLYAQAGDNVIALNHLIRAGESAPQNIMSEADRKTADILLEDLAGHMAEAKENYKNNPMPENALAKADFGSQAGDFAGADAICRDIYNSNPKNVKAVACLASISEVRGERSAVLDYARQWLALSPDDPYAYYRLARSYTLDPPDYGKAAENYEATVRHASGKLDPPTLLEAQLGWPKSYAQGEMWQEAAKAHDAVISLFPSEPDVLNSAAWFYATTKSNQKNPIKALELAKRAVDEAPDDAEFADTLAEFYYANGRIDEAIKTEQKALAMAPNREDFKKHLAKFQQAKPQRRR